MSIYLSPRVKVALDGTIRSDKFYSATIIGMNETLMPCNMGVRKINFHRNFCAVSTLHVFGSALKNCNIEALYFLVLVP